jgi:hypothetical protein
VDERENCKKRRTKTNMKSNHSQQTKSSSVGYSRAFRHLNPKRDKYKTADTYSQRKKGKGSPYDTYLEPRSKNRGRLIIGSMPVDADNHADIHSQGVNKYGKNKDL